MDVINSITRRAACLFAVILFIFLCTMACHDFVRAGNPGPLQTETVSIPCSDMEYFSDSRFFRATGSATHPNPRIAERMARLSANAQLSANIEVSVQSVATSYVKAYGGDGDSGDTEIFVQLTRQTTERHLRNIQVVCNQTRSENDQYTVYLAVEVAAEDVFSGLEEEFKNNASVGHLYDKNAFKSLFEEEMQALEAPE